MAADTGKPLIMERIVGNLVFKDGCPDIGLGQIGQRVDLDQMELGIPAHNGSMFTVRTLVPSNSADPSLFSLYGLVNHSDLAIVATSIGVTSIDWAAVLSFVLFH